MLKNATLRIGLAVLALLGCGIIWDGLHLPRDRWHAAGLRIVLAINLLTGSEADLSVSWR